MRIAITGDTHGKLEKIKKELQIMKPDYLLFTGDHFSEGKKIARYLNIDFKGVAGNCDPGGSGKKEQTFELGGKQFYLLHGHQYGVKRGLNSLYFRGKELGVDAVIFGHTHIALCENLGDLWIINPGSPSLPRLGKKGSYVLLELENSGFNPTIVYI